MRTALKMTLPPLPIIDLDWWVSVLIAAGGYTKRIHSQRVHGIGGRYMGRLLCRWDEKEGEDE